MIRHWHRDELQFDSEADMISELKHVVSQRLHLDFMPRDEEARAWLEKYPSEILLVALTYTRKHLDDDPEFSAGNIAMLEKFGDTSYQDRVIEIFLKLARAIIGEDQRSRHTAHGDSSMSAIFNGNPGDLTAHNMR